MTSSFGIQPQRQVRDYFEAPERQAAPAAPAEPALTSQRRGGEVLDFQTFKPDLKLAQQVKAIESFTEAATGLSTSLVEQDAKKQVATAARLFDQIAQYQVDTLEIGEAAKQLRKKGKSELADQIASTNPWFRYGWLKSKAEFAGQKTVINTQNWINANMGELEQIEDPTDITKRLQEYSQGYYQKNYPDIPVQMYSGLVAPVLANALPKLTEGIAEKHLVWKKKVNEQRGRQTLTDATSVWSAIASQGRRNPATLQQANEALQAAVLKSQTDYTNAGFSRPDWVEKVAIPWAKTFLIDKDDNGVNDIVDKSLESNLKSALNFKLPGLGDISFLDLTDPESGRSIRTLITQQRIAGLELESKIENITEQKEFRAKRVFGNALSFTLDRELAGLEGEERLDRQQSLYNKIEQARTSGGTIELLTQDPETGAVVRKSFSVPYGFDLNEARKSTFGEGTPADPRQYIRDQEEVMKLLRDNPLADIPDNILRRYYPGSSEWNWFNSKKIQSRDNFTQKEWTAEISDLEASAAAEAERLNKTALAEALKGVTGGGRAQTAIKAKYSNALKIQKDEAREFARRYARSIILNGSPADLQNPNYWDTIIKNRMLKTMSSNELFVDPRQSFPGVRPTAVQDPYMSVTRNPNTGEVETAMRLLSPADFIAANKKLLSSGKLKWYWANQPMISNESASNIASAINSQKPFSTDAVNDLRDGYKIATQMNTGLTLQQFLQGQFNKKNFDIRGANNKPLPMSPERLKELQNRIADTVSRPKGTTQVKYTNSGLSHNHNPGAVDFWIEDKKTRSMRVPFAAPVKMQITEVNFAPGNYGNYSRARVLENYGGLKVGDILSIGHARGFGTLQPGRVLYPGEVWGYQHDERSYRVGVDQAATPGAGVHLDINIVRNGRRLTQSEMRKIFENTLVNRLTL